MLLLSKGLKMTNLNAISTKALLVSQIPNFALVTFNGRKTLDGRCHFSLTQGL